MIQTAGHWEEFKIFVKQYEEPSEEDQRMADLGLPSKNSDPKKDYKLTRISFPLESVVDYFESYNSDTRTKGVCVTLDHGVAYFITTTYEKFKALRVAAGIERTKVKVVEPTEDTF